MTMLWKFDLRRPHSDFQAEHWHQPSPDVILTSIGNTTGGGCPENRTQRCCLHPYTGLKLSHPGKLGGNTDSSSENLAYGLRFTKVA